MELVLFFEDVIKWWCQPWNLLSGIMSIVALSGTILNAERNKIGFLFWLVSNLYMAVRFCVIEEYAQMVLFFAYFLLAIKGIIVWEAKEAKQKEGEEAIKKMSKISKYMEEHYGSKEKN